MTATTIRTDYDTGVAFTTTDGVKTIRLTHPLEAHPFAEIKLTTDTQVIELHAALHTYLNGEGWDL